MLEQARPLSGGVLDKRRDEKTEEQTANLSASKHFMYLVEWCQCAQERQAEMIVNVAIKNAAASHETRMAA